MSGRTNIPPESRPLIGRAPELAELGALLRDDRLVTIAGPAGVGKTSLARRAALSALRSHRGGAWFCDLTEATTSDDVRRVVARVLGVPLLEARDAGTDRIGKALAGRGRVLVVLDNMEQLIGEAAATVGAWLAAARGARFLVTSRERLHLDGERVVELQALADDAAIALFHDLARRADQRRALREEDAPAIAALVRELDGLPLAIELAAARLGVLSPAQILERLPRRFELLTGGSRDAAGRSRTLHDAIHASWAILAPWERAALAQSAVFRGGFSLDAAQAVLDLGAHPGAPPLVDVLQALRDKSLLRPERALLEVRLGHLATVREFAASALPGDALAAVEARHSTYFARASAEWSRRVGRAGGGAVMARMLLEQDNLLVAVTRGLAASDPAARVLALEALVSLEPVFSTHGPFATYVTLLERASAAAPAAPAPPAYVAVLSALARALCAAGRVADASLVAARAIALAEAQGLRTEEVRARAALGLTHRQSGRAIEAEAEYRRALDLADPADDIGVGDLLLKLGNLDLARGLHASAGDAYRRALERLEAAGDLRRAGWALGNLAIVAFSAGEDPSPLYLRAAEIARDLGDRRAEAFTQGNLAQFDQQRGAWAEAHALLERATAALRDIGDERAAARFELDWGTLLHEEGRVEEARARYREALRKLRAVGDRPNEAFAIACAASAEVALGRAARAAEDYAEAERLLRATDNRLGPLIVDVHRALLAVAEGRLDAAERALEEARAIVDRPSDLRFSMRLLERALAAGAPRTLRLGPGAGWFQVPGGPRVPLAPRSPLRGLLLRLAAAHGERPGEALGVADLCAGGWPDERVLPAAGANRVRVALATLRKLGLREVLAGGRDGWLLDAGWRVAIEARGPREAD